MATPAQIARCQSDHERWGYVERAEWIDEQLRQGRKQRLCSSCRRWKFQTEQCTAFREAGA